MKPTPFLIDASRNSSQQSGYLPLFQDDQVLSDCELDLAVHRPFCEDDVGLFRPFQNWTWSYTSSSPKVVPLDGLEESMRPQLTMLSGQALRDAVLRRPWCLVFMCIALTLVPCWAPVRKRFGRAPPRSVAESTTGLSAVALECGVYEAEYCTNYPRGQRTETPSALECRESCMDDAQCTGGHFYDVEKSCYHFGSVGAKDMTCAATKAATSDIHRFDCSGLRKSNLDMDVDERPFSICAGMTEVAGIGSMSIVSAKWYRPGKKAGKTVVGGRGVLTTSMKGRAYFADQCQGNDIYGVRYTSMRLLGRRFSYTVDLSGAECGCSAAMKLTAMASNAKVGLCRDHYCDAGDTCGVRCAEIEIQESNKYAWYSTLHVQMDPDGVGTGYGTYRREWNASVYGPGARCIDTDFPFKVEAFFPVLPTGRLVAMEVTLSQPNQPCTLTTKTDQYPPDQMMELTAMLQQGATPVVSYVGIGENVSWLDGESQGSGPGCLDLPAACQSEVKFWDFAVE